MGNAAMKWLENMTGNYSSSARVVDGTLIISLPDAVSPVVWRMDLGHVTASALEVRKQDNGQFVLTLKTPRGDVHDIAPYDNRGRAVQALMAVSQAMEQAHGQIRSAAANDVARANLPALRTSASPKSTRSKILSTLLGLVLLIGLIALLIGIGGSLRIGPMPTSSSGFSASSNAGATGAAGVPLSADDFLRNR